MRHVAQKVNPLPIASIVLSSDETSRNRKISTEYKNRLTFISLWTKTHPIPMFDGHFDTNVVGENLIYLELDYNL